jgi:hypothetical protein
VANGLGLTLNVGEEGPVVIPLQPLLDQGPEDDLKAHREFERRRRLPRKDPSPVQDVLGDNEKDSGFIFEHHHLRTLPARPATAPTPAPVVIWLYNFDLLYNL